MIVYLDTSVVLRVLLGQPKPLAAWGQWQAAYASELMGIEARRCLDRLRLEHSLDDEGLADAQAALGSVERSVGTIRLTRPVLRRAAQPMGTVVRTLDALHLASALLYEEQRGATVVFATHDVRQAVAARALGLVAIGV